MTQPAAPSTQPESKVVLVTGASSGIGEATARLLAAAGHRVVAGARRIDRLEGLAENVRTAGGDLTPYRLDVAERTSVDDFVAAALERHGRVDVLVNNAGVMPLSPIADLRVDEWTRMIDVNLRGPLYAVAAALPHMLRQGSGHVVNLSSVSGHRVDPTAAIYSATKFAIGAFSEGLRQESEHVRVTVISPGFTRTELTDHGGSTQARSAARDATDMLAISPTAVARAIAFAVAQPTDVDVNEIVVRPTAQR